MILYIYYNIKIVYIFRWTPTYIWGEVHQSVCLSVHLAKFNNLQTRLQLSSKVAGKSGKVSEMAGKMAGNSEK